MNKPIFLAILFLSAILAKAQNAGITILKNINLNRNTHLDNVFKGISNSVAPVSLIAPVTFLATGIIKHDSILKNKGAVMAATAVLAVGIETGLKYAIDRKRPYVSYPFINNVVTENTPSFPSGHTTLAFSTATSLSLAFPKWYVIVPSYLWAGTVGYSRLDLGVHYPSDVLGGAITGIGSAYLCYKANKWLQGYHTKK